MDLKNTSFISYGQVSKDFKTLAKLFIQLNKVKNKEVPQTKVDCYLFTGIDLLQPKFTDINLPMPKDMEIFHPSMKYPPHTDKGGLSYFIPLESGIFSIDGVDYPVVPFVLYAFDDGKLHNTNFCAIMLK